MANNFKATLDDLPEILSSISFQLDRIANILQLTDPEETKSTTTHIQKMIEMLDKESKTDEFPQTKNSEQPKYTPSYIRGILAKIANEENNNEF